MKTKTYQFEMLNKTLKHISKIGLLVAFLSTNNSGQAQTINSISVPGAVATGNSQTFDVEFYSSTNSTSNLENYKEIRVDMTNTKGGYLIFDDSSTSSNWEVVQGQPTGGSYFKFCKAMQINQNACRNNCVVSFYIRNIGTTPGIERNRIRIGLGTNGNSCTYNVNSATTLNVTVNKVPAGVYTWIEPASGTDSSYKIASNWAPTRSTVSTSDILVVDLATTTARNTTIDISNLTETINQFKIFPRNHVTFRCSANTTWTVGATSSTAGDDFIVDTLAFYRKTGVGTLDIKIPATNTARVTGRFTNVAGTTLFSGAGTHNISGDIYTVGGTLAFKPATGTNTLYLKGGNQSINGTAGNLEIDSAMNVTVGPGSTSTLTLNRTLPIYSVLTLNNSATLVSNAPASNSSQAFNAWVPNLQLKATEKVGSRAYGQLNTLGTGAAITGGAQFESFNATRRSYRGFGVPLKNGVNLSQFADDITTTGDVSGANADSFTTACSYCTHSIYRWNEPTQEWLPYASGNTPTNVPFGKGLLVFFRGTIDNGLGDTSALANFNTVKFKGQLHTGNASYTLSKSTGNNSGLGGFNWVSNPYPSNLNFRSVCNSNGNSIFNKYYVYDAIAKTFNTWDSSIAGSAPGRSGAAHFTQNTNEKRWRSKMIAPGASFFVLAKSNGASLNFTESMKDPYLTSSTKHFNGVQEETPSECKELKLYLTYQTDTLADADGFSMFYDMNHEGVTNDGDPYDMVKMYAGSLAIGSITANKQWLTLDRRANLTEVVGGTYTVPLQIKFPKLAPKDFNIGFTTCDEGSKLYKIQLVDKLTKNIVEVENNGKISFTIGDKDQFREDRFELLFTKNSISVDGELVVNSYALYPNPSSTNTFNVTNDVKNNLKTVTVYDAMGKVVYTKEISRNFGVNSIDLPQTVKSGMYFVVLQGEHHTENKTLIIQ